MPRRSSTAVLLAAWTAAFASAEAPGPLATSGPKPPPADPPAREEVQAAVDRGVDFLIESQLPSGAWGSHSTGKYYRVYAPLPDAHFAFRTAVTGLAVSALVDARPHADGQRAERLDEALRRGGEWLLEHSGKLRRAAPDFREGRFGYTLYSVWGHAYSVSALAAMERVDLFTAEQKQAITPLIEHHVERLARDCYLGGGWGYYDSRGRTQRPAGNSNCFATATVLIALEDARPLGVQAPKAVESGAVLSIQRQRFPDFAYAYGAHHVLRPRYSINRPAGSLGRSQVCNLALRLYGDEAVTDEVIRTWLDRLIARNGWLSIGRKTQRPHESHFAIAGYFYYYAHLYAAMCIDLLPESERAGYHGHLAALLLPLQERDGSWWDFMLYNYHQQYGTAMAVSTLCRGLGEPATAR